MRSSEGGQATVELAVSIPLLTIMLLLMVQVGVVLLDQVAVTQAAREGARSAAVDPTPGAAAAAAAKATGLDAKRLSVTVGQRPDASGFVRVGVSYTTKVVFPGTDKVLLTPTVRAQAAMRVEDPA